MESKRENKEGISQINGNYKKEPNGDSVTH